MHWVFVAVRGLSLVAASGCYSSLQCAGFSSRWLLLLRSTGSKCVGFSGCGARALLLRGMWDLTGPGLEPVSPALAGGFLTTAPPGKPEKVNFYCVSHPVYGIWLWQPELRQSCSQRLSFTYHRESLPLGCGREHMSQI